MLGAGGSASPGAWDPAKLEQVGPIGQDLETARGVAPGTHAHGDLPSRLSQSCPTTNRYCWLGAATVTAAAPRLVGRRQGGRTKSSGQLARRLALLPHPHSLSTFGHQVGMARSPLTGSRQGQKTLSGNHVCPRARSHSLPLRPPPAWYSRPVCIGRRLGTPGARRAPGTWTHVPPGQPGLRSQGETQCLTQSLGPNAQSGAGPPTRSLGTLTLHSPEISPTALRHHGAKVRTPPFVNISSFFI